MGSIVKSIGKVIKKIGKGLKKVIKKIGPALLIAAAVYAGVAFYGASVTGVSGLGTANFSQGLQSMGQKLMGFFSPTGTAPVVGQGVGAAGQYGASISGAAGIVPTLGETAAAQFAGGNVLGEFAMGAAVTPGSATAFMGDAALTNVVKQNIIKSFTSSVAGGMTTGQALVYMTKMNMLATGVQMVAGFLDDSEKKQMQHDKELLAMRYAYGKPMTDEQKAWKAQNPNWIREHPAIAGTQTPPRIASAAKAFAPKTMANLPTETVPPSPYVQQQRIGQPTFGRRSTKQFETPAPRTMASKGPGLLTRAAQGRFKPTQQRRYS